MTPDTFLCGAHTLLLKKKTHVMGVLNVTPDSFSDGGRYFNPDDALRQADRMIAEGVDIIDVGGESSRPAGPYGVGAQAVSNEEETDRTAPVIEAIAERFDTPISIDTVKSGVARAAISAGASIVNDISGLRHDPQMADAIAATGASVVLMHMQGSPSNMQRSPRYEDLITEVRSFLANAAQKAETAGISRNRIAVDPGLGFGKTYAHNYEIIRRLSAFADLGYPLLLGASRKTFVGMDYALPPDQREEGSLAAAVICACNGAHIIRVHDVQAAKRALFVADKVRFPTPNNT
jgi:dihydropteroate synthase